MWCHFLSVFPFSFCEVETFQRPSFRQEAHRKPRTGRRKFQSQAIYGFTGRLVYRGTFRISDDPIALELIRHYFGRNRPYNSCSLLSVYASRYCLLLLPPRRSNKR